MTAPKKRDHVRAYIGRGWKVFALSNSKKPLRNCAPCDTGCPDPADKEQCTCLTCHGFYAATTDEDRADAMFMADPDRCVAIRTGAPSGLLVVDVDGPEGAATMQTLIADGMLPRTLTVRTGSGGYHLYYQHPGIYVMSGAGKIGHKIDSKADGAYVVAAPSIHPRTGQPYRWVNWEHPVAEPPGWLVEKLRRPAPVSTAGVALGRTPGHLAHSRMKGLISTVLDAAEGNGNNSLYWASCKAGEMVARGELTEDQAHAALFDAATAIGIRPGDAGRDPHHGTIGSGLRKGARS